jgi:hypothetical protein
MAQKHETLHNIAELASETLDRIVWGAFLSSLVVLSVMALVVGPNLFK